MSTYVFLGPVPAGPPDETPAYRACLGLANSLGLELAHRPAAAGGAAYFDSRVLRFGQQFDPAALEAGDILLLPDLKVLGTVMVAVLKVLRQRGVNVYCAALGPQPALNLLSTIEATAAAFVPLVRENDELRREVQDAERHWKGLYDQTVAGALHHAVQLAVPRLVAAMPILGETNPRGEPTPAHVGELIAFERERQGLTSTALGQMAGVSQTSIARLETGEVTSGPARDKCMEILFGPRAKTVEGRYTIARTVEEHGGGSVSAAEIIA